VTDIELGALQEKVARLEGWRSWLVEAAPLALVGVLLARTLTTILGVEHQLTVVEEHLGRIEAKLDVLVGRQP
jgi:hypothetical protein